MHINNNKNKLQEYYQKSHLPIPIYQTERCTDANNQLLWVSTVTLYDDMTFTGNMYKKKSDAEKSAAFIALSTLSLEPPIRTLNHKYDKNTVMLIDIENMPKFFYDIPAEDLKDPNLTVYGFIGINHSLMDKINHSKLNKIISPSTRPDGTDTCIQVYVGIFLANNMYEYYIIVTRDHFGQSLVEMITSDNLGWKSQEAKVIVKYENI